MNTQVTFVAEGEKFIFTINKLPVKSLLSDITETFPSADNTYEFPYTKEDLQVIHNYLMKGILPTFEQLTIIDRLGISEFHSYELATLRENHMRNNMYQPEYINDEMNTDFHYNLIKITENSWNNLRVNTDTSINPDSIIVESANLKKNKWRNPLKEDLDKKDTGEQNTEKTEDEKDNGESDGGDGNSDDECDGGNTEKSDEKGNAEGDNEDDTDYESGIERKLGKLKKLLNKLNETPGKCIIAGGKIFNILFKKNDYNSDIDIFMCGCTKEDAEKKIYKLLEYVKEKFLTEEITFPPTENNIDVGLDEDNIDAGNVLNLNQLPLVEVERGENFGVIEDFGDIEDIEGVEDNYAPLPVNIIRRLNRGRYINIGVKLIRTKNAITVSINDNKTREYQIVLRIYKSMSEVLHGFDVDSCCIGYDGENIWTTQRSMYSFIKGYNTFNFDRLSPSYEIRLIKYATRGMKIYVPGLDKNKVNVEELEKFHTSVTKDEYGNEIPGRRYSFVPQIKNLDRLLYFEYRIIKYNFNMNTLEAIQRVAEEFSDYSGYNPGRTRGGNYISSILGYLKHSSPDYPEKAKEYLPLLDKMYDIALEEYINHDERTSKIKSNIKDLVCSVYGETGQELYRPDLVNYIDKIYNNMSTFKNLRRTLNIHKKFKSESVIGTFNNFHTNSMLTKKFSYLLHEDYYYSISQSDSMIRTMDVLLHPPAIVYDILQIVHPWDFERDITFKTINPGEQMTNTFNKIVIEDNSEWYKGKFYINK